METEGGKKKESVSVGTAAPAHYLHCKPETDTRREREMGRGATGARRAARESTWRGGEKKREREREEGEPRRSRADGRRGEAGEREERRGEERRGEEVEVEK